MQKAIAIGELAPNANLMVLTNAGRLYQYKPAQQPGAPGTWSEVAMHPDINVRDDIRIAEKLNVAGRLHKGYELYKRNDNGLFYWEREEDHVQSEQFERMEGAIASARQDWMIRHPPKPPPRPEQPLPEPEPEPVP